MSGSGGFVYLIRPRGHDVYKVGCSIDPTRRLRTIQGKSPSLDLELVAQIYYPQEHDRAEDAWHRVFAAWRLPGGREWFALPAAEVERFRSAAQRIGAR